jgi:hypothetical protein
VSAQGVTLALNGFDLEKAAVDLWLLASLSPIAWSNVILYGEYKLCRELVQ